MNCYIINFNRLKWTKQLAIDLADRGFTPIILDNNSSYPPLLDWYNSSDFKFKLVKFDQNHGHRVFYHSGFYREVKSEYFAMTDPDLDITCAPEDFEEVLMKGFSEEHEFIKNNDDIIKVGLNLKIDDLPEKSEDLIFDPDSVINHEKSYGGGETKKGLYIAAQLDTTFAIYKNDGPEFGQRREYSLWPSIRTAPPYEARHLPWYSTYSGLDEEDKYYMNSIRRKDVDWSWRMKCNVDEELHGIKQDNSTPIEVEVEIGQGGVLESKQQENIYKNKDLDNLSAFAHLSNPPQRVYINPKHDS